MVQGFEAAATQEEPSNQKLGHLVQLQGAALDAQTVALNAERNDELLSDQPGITASGSYSPGTTSLFYNANLTTVEHLTLSRPLWPYGTPILDYINRTELFETDLATAVSSIRIGPVSIPKLGIAAAADLAQIEAASFTADINLSTLQRPGLDTFMNQQVGTLLTQINAAAQSGPSGAAAFAAAVQSFTTATYDQTTARILGPAGAYGRYFVQPTTANQVPSEAYENAVVQTTVSLLHGQHLRLRQIQGDAVAQDCHLPSQLRQYAERDSVERVRELRHHGPLPQLRGGDPQERTGPDIPAAAHRLLRRGRRGAGRPTGYSWAASPRFIRECSRLETPCTRGWPLRL